MARSVWLFEGRKDNGGDRWLVASAELMRATARHMLFTARDGGKRDG
jgi:hypothetical protein